MIRKCPRSLTAVRIAIACVAFKLRIIGLEEITQCEIAFHDEIKTGEASQH